MAERPAVLDPEEILITGHLYARPPRRPDLRAEVNAFQELSSLTATDAERAVQRFLEIALDLCGAGSAGLSLLESGTAGEAVFRWHALAGRFAPYVGGTTPRNHSPCGLCLDHHHTILVSLPARAFSYLGDTGPEIVEGLLVPLYDTGKKPIGTLWIVSHDVRKRFSATDARIMEQLAVQLTLALKVLQERNLLERIRTARKTTIQELNHRVKNGIQSAMSFLKIQARTTSSEEARIALTEAALRLKVFGDLYSALQQTDGSDESVGLPALLGSVADGLRQFFPEMSDRVSLRTRIDGVSLDPERAIPVALTVNEAVINAYKHAFPDGRSGEIVVSVEKAGIDGTGVITIHVSDDGVGLPEQERRGSLGMHLIRGFSDQLGGDLEISTGRNRGTALRLSIPADRRA
jgi:two-component sensor histidine kinase